MAGLGYLGNYSCFSPNTIKPFLYQWVICGIVFKNLQEDKELSTSEWKSNKSVRDIVVRMLRVLDEASKDVKIFGELIGPFQIPNVEIAYEDKEGTHIVVHPDDYDVISENRVDFGVLMEIYQTT